MAAASEHAEAVARTGRRFMTFGAYLVGASATGAGAGPGAGDASLPDMFAIPSGTDSAECCGHMNTYMRCVLRYGDKWHMARAAAEADPTCALAQLLLCDFCIACSDMAAAQVAWDAAVTALAAAPVARRRDALYLRAWQAWLAGNLDASARLFGEVLVHAPGDLFALKRSQLLYFLCGQLPAMLTVASAPPVRAANWHAPYYHGMLAFALEQNCRLGEAEEHGRRAVAVHSGDVWAHHAVAHALYFGTRLKEGLAWMRECSSQWTHLCSFMLAHNWWHVALFHLDLGEFDHVARVFDEHVWGVDKTNVEDQLGALGMLLKWDLRLQAREAHAKATGGTGSDGEDACGTSRASVSSRVADVVAHSKARAHEHLNPLFDVLHMWALASQGKVDETGAALRSLEAAVAKLPHERRITQGRVWATTAKAMAAFGQGDASSTPVSELHGVLGERQCLGGSSEQLDVIEEVYIESLLRAQRVRDAARIVADRVRARRTAGNLLLLARCQTTSS